MELAESLTASLVIRRHGDVISASQVRKGSNLHIQRREISRLHTGTTGNARVEKRSSSNLTTTGIGGKRKGGGCVWERNNLESSSISLKTMRNYIAFSALDLITLFYSNILLLICSARLICVLGRSGLVCWATRERPEWSPRPSLHSADEFCMRWLRGKLSGCLYRMMCFFVHTPLRGPVVDGRRWQD